MSDSVKIAALGTLGVCFLGALIMQVPTLPGVIIGGIFALLGIPAAVTGVRTLWQKKK